MRASERRRGSALVDALLVIAGLSLAAAVAYPPLRHRAFERRVAAVVSDVEAVRSAAEHFRDTEGRWPADAGEAHVPGELASLLPEGVELHTQEYALGWSRWAVVQVPPAPPPPPDEPDTPPPGTDLTPGRPATPPPAADTVGTRPPFLAELAGITVRSDDDGVLGALLERYGSATSFVRDSTWTLVLGPPRKP